MKIVIRDVRLSDVDVVAGLMREYYAYDRIRLVERTAKARLREFLRDPSPGRAWLVTDEGGAAMGYLVVTDGYGLEHGRNVTIDEFYLREPYRGGGIGKRIIRFAEQAARAAGVASIHTEVERANARARRFWEANGFHAHDRYPMVKMVKKGSKPGAERD